jgi:hypothetical protein
MYYVRYIFCTVIAFWYLLFLNHIKFHFSWKIAISLAFYHCLKVKISFLKIAVENFFPIIISKKTLTFFHIIITVSVNVRQKLKINSWFFAGKFRSYCEVRFTQNLFFSFKYYDCNQHWRKWLLKAISESLTQEWM